jgi:hypothetical protein
MIIELQTGKVEKPSMLDEGRKRSTTFLSR